MSKLALRAEGDRHIVVTRSFTASPEAVYRAHIEPELIRRWMLGPEGWTMPVAFVMRIQAATFDMNGRMQRVAGSM